MKKDKKIRRELLDELLAGYSKPEDLTGPEGLLKRLTGALVERALEAELTDHLGYEGTRSRVVAAATHATAAGPRRFRPSRGRYPSRSLATATARLSRSSSRSTSVASTASTTRS
jgi:hypothetical protein